MKRLWPSLVRISDDSREERDGRADHCQLGGLRHALVRRLCVHIILQIGPVIAAPERRGRASHVVVMHLGDGRLHGRRQRPRHKHGALAPEAPQLLGARLLDESQVLLFGILLLTATERKANSSRGPRPLQLRSRLDVPYLQWFNSN